MTDPWDNPRDTGTEPVDQPHEDVAATSRPLELVSLDDPADGEPSRYALLLGDGRIVDLPAPRAYELDTYPVVAD